MWQKVPYEKELQIQKKLFWWEIIREIEENTIMGHQEAYDFRFRISDNSHHETQQEAV